jgi:hypothetical protein
MTSTCPSGAGVWWCPTAATTCLQIAQTRLWRPYKTCAFRDTTSRNRGGLRYDSAGCRPAAGCGVAPAQSPPGITVTSGSTLSITATGSECNYSPPGCEPTGPDGNPSAPTTHYDGAQNGLSTIAASVNALIGVFLGSDPPNLTASPAQLGSNTAPVLKQVFLIGSSSSVAVPTGATRLFLGPMDGFQWNDNYGSFTVTITSH